MAAEGTDPARWQALHATLHTCREDLGFMQEVLTLAERRMQTLWQVFVKLEAELKGIEYADWTDEDSPKGETVPGVRYRWAEALSTGCPRVRPAHAPSLSQQRRAPLTI